MECNSVDALRRVMKSRSNPRHQLAVGDWVRVWRRFDIDPADLWALTTRVNVGKAPAWYS